MRFGLFYEHQLPRPWEQDAEERLFANALEQVELADRVGIDYVWEVEHHFLEEYAHSSAPEVFLAAASQRTSRIRLGHGIVQLPPPVNHPARVAERIATLDLISGGRVEFGTGESSSQAELGGFGVDRELKRAMWEEALDAVTRMFVEEPFAGYHGRFVDVPPRNVIPKPKQKPHPPLWVACSRRETILLAARKGMGALSFSFIEPEQAKEWADQYYELITSDECVPAGFAVNPNLAVVVPFMCHQDEETAIARGIDGAHFFGYSLAHDYVFGDLRPGRTSVWDEFQANRERQGFSRDVIQPGEEQLGVNILQQGLGSLRGAVGTPAQVLDLMQRYEAAGVDQVILVAQAGPNRHEDVCEAIELFAKEVLPEFAGRAEEQEAAKRERLAEATERALARRPPARVFDRDYLITPQGEPSSARLPGAVPLRSERTGTGPQRAVQGALGAYVRRRDDAAIERRFGGTLMQRMVFRGMARSFRPDKAGTFQGDIEYRLTGTRGDRSWVIRVDGRRAVATPGSSPEPALVITTPIALFVRMIARDVTPAKAWMEGRIQIEGSFDVAARLGQMFGQGSPW
jgi:alkanesulfonate monooxygenase SsuD/methylene tetrahydromethanopterin reductase-like flavin-dependent oxidoreductase (luciferase family)